MKVQFIQNPFHGERNVAEQSAAPAYIDDETLRRELAEIAGELSPSAVVELTKEEDARYGRWIRLAMADRHLASHVEAAARGGALPIGLLANCNSLMGMLAGLQRAGGLRMGNTVGLIWIDAHADFNTPETTLSGMLGGMPVATSAGLCLHQLRETAGMKMPIRCEHILMCGLRDVDAKEGELLDAHRVGEITVDDLLRCAIEAPPAIGAMVDSTDAVYVHIDMDVLDPAEVAGHPLTVPGGPTSEHLAEAMESLFGLKGITALGIASSPPLERDAEGCARTAAHRLITGAVRGCAGRSSGA